MCRWPVCLLCARHCCVCVFCVCVQVKLRRQQTEGEVWEVVSMQGADETFSVLASLKRVIYL